MRDSDIDGYSSYPIVLLLLLGLIMLIPFATLAFAQEVPNASEEIDDGFDELGRWFDGLISNANLTGTETPLNTTESELQDLLDGSIQTGKSGKNFLFDFHHLIELFIIALSPIDIDPLFVLLISWGVGSITVYFIFKKSLPHLILFGVIFGIVILLFMIGGINPEF